MRRVVIVFGRLPVEGRTKTRLAKDMGSDALACDFYRACAEHILRQAHAVEDSVVLFFYADAADHDAVASWMREAGFAHLIILPQAQQTNLGERMAAAFEHAMGLEDVSDAIIVGTDIPDISTAIISDAFSALANHDVVIGDSGDGGYYLLGQRHTPSRGLFTDITYSNSSVLEATTQKARGLGLDLAPVTTLPCAHDIDHLTDLEMWLSTAAHSHPLYTKAADVLSQVQT